MQQRAPLGAILQQMGVVSFEQIEEALEYQQRDGCKIGEALIKLGYALPDQITQALAKQYHMLYMDLDSVEVPFDVINLLAAEVALENKVVPIQLKDRSVVVAMADPLDFVTIDNIRFILNKEVECVLCTPDGVERALSKYYRPQKDLEEELERLEDTSDIELRDDDFTVSEGVTADDAPVIRLVQALITEAIKQRASDIHIEPFEDKLRVRYRIDGMCMEQDPPPKRLQGAIISRIKIMARMDMAEKRRPQDGAIKLKLMGREFDFRVSALPASHGESVVLRILDKEEGLVPLEVLGFDESDYARFKKLIKRPNGIFLVTGPTGSGKTTTLYASLKELNKPNVKIITAEDPIEYHLVGVNQCQVNRKVGLTFARIIRSMLRQAPNIILVGEIRDRETAETAIQAALTGHLVFSTLHTNDAPSALPRLVDLGVKPFLVSSGVIGVMAQRLLRVLCTSCKEPYTPTDSELRAIGLSASDIKDTTVYRAAGCPECGYRGYRGRKGIFELMIMTNELREMTFRGRDSSEIRKEAHSQGMITLQEDAVRKIMSGMTSIQEVLRVTAAQEFFH
jgi:type IV pilus assembly protein PilB